MLEFLIETFATEIHITCWSILRVIEGMKDYLCLQVIAPRKAIVYFLLATVLSALTSASNVERTLLRGSKYWPGEPMEISE